MKLHPYLNYAGNCEEAFRFYETHLGGKITMLMRHRDQPGPSNVPPEWTAKVLHATLAIAGTQLSGADIPSAQPMRSAYMTLTVDTVEEAERIYAVLQEGGEIFMTMASTFFAQRFAMLRDRFGTSWAIVGAPQM
jgi:PhnB protein